MANELTKIPKFRRCVLQNFPFIEQDFDALTDYQLLCKVVEYLNNVITHQNTLDDHYTDLVNMYNTLVDFVNDYFENLDVQEEINNKLDQMVEDGTLTTLISDYVDPYINAQNARIDAQDNAIDAQDSKISAIETTIAGLNAGSPVFVSSTDDMTDESKIYVLNTDGSIYYYNGTEFVDSGLDYGADSLMFTGYTTLVNSTSVLDDFNNAIPNRAYCVTAHDIPHQPSTKAGTLITFRYVKTTTTNKAGTVQLYITSDGLEFYERVYWSTGWKEWKQIHTFSPTDAKSIEWLFTSAGQVSSTDDLDDFNNAKFNKCYLIFATDIPNQPIAEQGSLITFRHTSSISNLNGFVQLFITKNDKLYYRYYYNNYWHDWKQIVTSDNLPYGLANEYSSLAVFEKIGVIGDSFASGFIDSAEEGHRNRYSISWPQVMGRNNGVNVINFATGGLSTRTWLTSAKGLTLLNSSTAQDLYLIALGINDIGDISDNLETLGSIADIDLDNPETNPNTFYGNYGKILSAIKTKSADAKVVLITIPKANTGNNKMINDAIIEIATTLDLPVIISHENPIFTSTYFTNEKGSGGHPTLAGYGTMAQAYSTMLNICIATYYDYFKDYIGNETIS